MKNYLAGTGLLMMILLVGSFSVKATEELLPEELYARSAVLMDADSGRVLFTKNGNESMANASTTKILTCILALENASLQDIVTVSQKAAMQPAVHLGMKKDQQFYLEDLLYSLMLESHNDTAVALAEHISGSVEAFADLMNEKLRKIGCERTHFVSPNGLDWEDENGAHETTAEDLALLMRYCISESEEKEKFLEITGTSNWTFTDCSGENSYSCVNHNAFLNMMEGALSGKTGFTNKAGYCYIGALKEEERTFIVALLACGWPNNKGYKWSDTRKMMEYALEQYHYETVDYPLVLQPITVIGGVKTDDLIEIEEESGEKKAVLLSKNDEVKIQVTLPQKLYAPVMENTKVGLVRYLLNGQEYQRYPLVTKESIERKDYRWCVKKTVAGFLKLPPGKW